MILDERLTLADDQDLHSNGTNVAFTNDIDLRGGGASVDPDVGGGQPVYVVIVVTTAFAGGTSVEFIIGSDAASAITPASATKHISTGAIPVASLTAGATFVLMLPPGSTQEYERYLGGWAATVGTGTEGDASVFLTLDPTGYTMPTDSNIN